MIRLEMAFLYLAVVSAGLQTQAAEKPYCTDLASVSCDQNSVVADGTGTRYFRTPEEISAALMPAFAKAKPKIADAISYGLSTSNPDGKGKNSLQGKAIRAYGLNLDSKSGCQVLVPPNDVVRAEAQELPADKKSAKIRTCHLRLRELLFEHLKVQSLAESHAQEPFPSTASPTAMLELEKGVEFKTLLSFLQDEVEREALKGDLDKRIRELFPDVKKLMIARVRSMGLSAEDEERAVRRLAETAYQPGGCSIHLQDNPLYHANAYLSPNPQGSPTFSFCPSFLLSTDSEFSLVATMAHEMAHAIDPCRLGSKIAYTKNEYDPALENIFDKESPIAPLLGCLRNEKSVGAVSCPLEKLKARKASKEKCKDDPLGCLIVEKNLDGNKTRESQTEESVTISSCHDDQITETVSDWFGAETLEAYMRERRPKLSRDEFRAGVSNAFRPICHEEEVGEGEVECDSHPPSAKRIERIINSNPRLRARMGCSEKHPKGHLYCDRGPMPPKVLSEDSSGSAPVSSEQSGGIK